MIEVLKLFESLLNDVLRIFGQFQRGQFLSRKPANLFRVAGRKQLPSDRAAEEINQHIVVLYALSLVPQDTVVDAKQFAWFDNEPCLFASLANGRLAHEFSDFKNAPGDRPLRLQWRVGTLDKKDSRALDDNGADTDKGEFREFTFHTRGQGPGIRFAGRVAIIASSNEQ